MSRGPAGHPPCGPCCRGGSSSTPGNSKKKHPRPARRDLAVLQYTSGTTGLPKAAMLTHANLQANAAQGRAWVPGLKDGRETVYAVLPMFHAYGLTLCMTFALSIGAKLVLFPKFDVDLVLKALKKSPATFLPAVPPIYDRIAAAAAERGIGLESIRFSISGAMNLPTATVETWEKATGGYLIEGYGLTETSPIAIGNPFGPSRKPGTVGVPFPLTDIRVVDPRNVALDRAPGEEGELLIRGPQVFSGYWNRPEETEEALLDGGWFRTGDIVSVDDDYFVTIRDRIKELIITGGFNVSPSEVEDVIATFPGVSEVSVVGLPRPGGGEDVVAAVVPIPGTTIDPDALLAFARENPTAYKVPRRGGGGRVAPLADRQGPPPRDPGHACGRPVAFPLLRPATGAVSARSPQCPASLLLCRGCRRPLCGLPVRGVVRVRPRRRLRLGCRFRLEGHVHSLARGRTGSQRHVRGLDAGAAGHADPHGFHQQVAEQRSRIGDLQGSAVQGGAVVPERVRENAFLGDGSRQGCRIGGSDAELEVVDQD